MDIDNSPVMSAFLAIIPVYVIIACGWFARRVRWLEQEHEAPIMKLSIDLFYPCLILSSMLGNDMLRSPAFTMQAVGIGFGGIILGIAIAWGVAKIIGLNVGTGLRTFGLAAGLQNYSFFVIPIIAVLYPMPGNPMMGILMTHNTGCELAIWTIGLMLMAGGVKAVHPKVFLRGPLIAIVLAITLVWTGLDRYVATDTVMTTLKMLGACAVPLMVFIFGNIMFDVWSKVKWNVKVLLAGCATRLVFIPPFFLLAAWLLPIDVELKRIIIIQSAIPSAIISTLLAKQFGGHPDMAIQITLSTTIVSFITLPLWLALGDMWIVPLQ